MSANADSLPIEDVHPEVPVSPPVQEPVAPPEKAPEPVVPQDKAPQQIPPDYVPRWRLNEVLEENRALKAQPAKPQQAPTAEAPKESEFATWEEYIRADAKFHAVEAAKSVMNESKTADEQKQTQGRIVDRLTKAESNWHSKVASATPEQIQTIQGAPVPPDQLAWIQIQEADNNIAVAEYLSQHPDEMQRINAMYPDQKAREITRLDLKLATVKGGPSKMPSAKAPDLDPVGGGNTPAPKNPYAPGTSEVDYLAATRRLPKR